MDFLRFYQHLLPDGRAWRTTTDKRLRQFFDGLAGVPGDVKTAADEVWADLIPATTTTLDAWERQFGLPAGQLTDEQRRARLAAAWGAVGGQSPRYIQDTLRSNGFDVYVHEWRDPSSLPGPGVMPRSPLLVIRREFTGVNLLIECGEVDAACGEPAAECGNGPAPLGYPLVNKIVSSEPNTLVLCGEVAVACGEPTAECGEFDVFIDKEREYIVPRDVDAWPYFIYIGGQDYGQQATVPISRKNEFEALCLKICPAHNWLGILVSYV